MKNLRDIALLLAVLAGTIWLCVAYPTRADEPTRVSVALVMAADVSGSIDYGRWKQQRDGYATALTHPAFLRAVEATPDRRIAVAFVEWAGIQEQRLVVDWTVIANAADAERLAERLRQNDRSFNGSTSIAGALDFSGVLLEICPHRFARAVVDVSGDGVNSDGQDVAAARDRLVLAGTTINGIIMFGPMSEPHLREHYEDQVIGGPGAFVMIADDDETFAYALVRKLVREVASR